MTIAFDSAGKKLRPRDELEAEIIRLTEAKRHFSALADAKGKENMALRAALANAKEKLEIYRSERTGEYTGGMEYGMLMQMIERALEQGSRDDT